MLFEDMPKEIYDFILKLKYIFSDIDMYLVGGVLRDFYLGLKTNDFDIAISDDVYIYIKEIEKIALINNAIKFTTNEDFHTVNIKFNNFNVDIASFREEIYEDIASLPKVKITRDIEVDMKRRDFSINTFYYLVDLIDNKLILKESYKHSLADFDMKNRQIRVLHKRSFLDDPTRIFRLFRYVVKLDFSVEENTNQILLNSDLETMFNKISYFRILNEFEKDFNQKNIDKIFTYYINYKIYDIIFRLNSNVVRKSFLDSLKKLNLKNKKNILFLIYYYYKDTFLYNEAFNTLSKREFEFLNSIEDLKNLYLECEYLFLIDFLKLDNTKIEFFYAIISNELKDSIQKSIIKYSKKNFFKGTEIKLELEKRNISNRKIALYLKKLNSIIYAKDITKDDILKNIDNILNSKNG